MYAINILICKTLHLPTSVQFLQVNQLYIFALLTPIFNCKVSMMVRYNGRQKRKCHKEINV